MPLRLKLLLLAVFILNGIFNSRFQLHYDETYYWVWSQHLALSYFDHPPMIAYMMYLTSKFGASEFFVRLPALTTGMVMLITIYSLSYKMFGEKVATIATYLGISWPLLQGVLLISTPDSPLIMFWALTLYAFYIGIFENKTSYIYLSGVLFGLTFLSKYTAVLLIPGLMLFLIFSPNYRKTLLNKHLYFAFILSLIISLPVLIWNYQHHWISFIYQITHGYDHARHMRIDSLDDFVTGQLGVSGPFMSVAMLYYFIKNRKEIIHNDKLAFLFWTFIFIILFFMHSSCYGYSGANWTMPGFISAFILLAYYLVQNNNKWIYRASLILIIIATFMAKMPTVLLPKALASKVSAISVFYGNRELANEVNNYLTPNTLLLACDYGNASRLWYYLNNTRRVYVLPRFKFANGYEYWKSNQVSLQGQSAVFVCDLKISRINYSGANQYFNTNDDNICLSNNIENNPVAKFQEKMKFKYYTQINSGNSLRNSGMRVIYYTNISTNNFDTIDTYFKHVNLIKKAIIKNPFNETSYFIYRVSN